MVVVRSAEAAVQAASAGRDWILDARDEVDIADWMDILGQIIPYVTTCAFVVVPDMPGDPETTRLLWDELAYLPAAYEFPVAYVAQPGTLEDNIPWDELDVLLTDDPNLQACAWCHGVTTWPTDLRKEPFVSVSR